MNFPFETNGKLRALGVPILKHFRVFRENKKIRKKIYCINPIKCHGGIAFQERAMLYRALIVRTTVSRRMYHFFVSFFSRGQLLKERICSSRSKFFHLGVDSVKELSHPEK